ncbi:hypothetical protein ACFLSJ_03365 [Verrucomicrobiota bacterium]
MKMLEGLHDTSDPNWPDFSDESALPFGDRLADVFLPARAGGADPIHGYNVLRFTRSLWDACLSRDFQPLLTEPGLLTGNAAAAAESLACASDPIRSAVGDDDECTKLGPLLTLAALYHDLGKSVRRTNHPQIGAMLIRHSDLDERNKVLARLVYDNETVDSEKQRNRLALIVSILRHHDKFGVLSTGEGALPILCDIPYFTSDASRVQGIKKNVTSVMLVNLGDIAGVNRAGARQREAAAKATAAGDLEELKRICADSGSTLGLLPRKIRDVLSDWGVMIASVECAGGTREELKKRLIALERTPGRAMRRIARLLNECAYITKADPLCAHFDLESVAAVLEGQVGCYEVPSFAERFAMTVKLDYGLPFFKALMCSVVRSGGCPVDDGSEPMALSQPERDWLAEHQATERLAQRAMRLLVGVLAVIVNRYGDVLQPGGTNRRFGVSMGNLTSDDRVRETVLRMLCDPDTSDVARSWIADEVSIWSMD